MPTRVLRDGILTSEAVSSLSWPAEVFYRRLMSVADDHGRFYGLPKLIRAACYPLQIDRVSDADIGKWLTECVTAALVSVYPAADGKRYIQIEKFGQQVRSKSKFPEPVACSDDQPCAIDNNCYQSLTDAHLVVVEGEDVIRTPARKRAVNFDARSKLLELGVTAAVADDFLALRKKKRAPLTETAITSIQRESDKAGLTLQQTLEKCCSRGWQGFEAAWLANYGGGEDRRADIYKDVI